MNAVEKEQAGRFARLLLRALPLATNVGEAFAAANYAMSIRPSPPISAQFSFDLANKRAAGILNRAVKASQKLTAKARKDFEAALSVTDPAQMGQAIIDFLHSHRMQMASLLGATQLAAILEGAREVAGHVPPIPPVGLAIPPPPTLPPHEALQVIDQLRPLSPLDREQRLTQMTSAEQGYVRGALAAADAGTPPPPRPFVPPPPGEGSPEEVHYPIIEEAVRELSEKNVLPRHAYDQLDAASRAKAFTITGVDEQETMAKVRDALAENAAKGVGLESFRKKVFEQVSPGTFLSEPHMETVFRNGIQAAFSDGQMNVLKHPFVQAGFPYSSVDSIHDSRVREDHLNLEKHGINGTNIFRIQDPVFQTFRPPWSWNCLLPGTRISGRYQIGLKSFYAGETVEIVTENGVRLAITANHPIVTLRGLVPANQIEKGDYCLTYLRDVEFQRNTGIAPMSSAIDRMPSRQVDNYHKPVKVEEVFRALTQLGCPRQIRCTPYDLHGEAKFGDGNIEIVGAYCKLLLNDNARFSQLTRNLFLPAMQRRQFGINSLRMLQSSFQRAFPAFLGLTRPLHSFLHLLGLSFPNKRGRFTARKDSKSSTAEMIQKGSNANAILFGQSVRTFSSNVSCMNRGKIGNFDRIKHPILVSESSVFGPETTLDFGESSHLYASIHKRFGERLVIDTSLTGQLVDSFPSQIAASKVVKIRKDHFRGHVFDLQGSPNFIIANGMLLGNCRCSWIPMTIRQAAAEGIQEAQKWLETGVEPSPPAFVPMPNFQPDPGFRRAIEGMPMSIRLSLESIDQWRQKEIHLANWVPYQGPRGGRGWQDANNPTDIRIQVERPGEREPAVDDPSARQPAAQEPVPAQPAANEWDEGERLYAEWAKVPKEQRTKARFAMLQKRVKKEMAEQPAAAPAPAPVPEQKPTAQPTAPAKPTSPLTSPSKPVGAAITEREISPQDYQAMSQEERNRLYEALGDKEYYEMTQAEFDSALNHPNAKAGKMGEKLYRMITLSEKVPNRHVASREDVRKGTIAEAMRRGLPVPEHVQRELRQGKALAIEEAYGSEPPGPGWMCAGECKWVRPRRESRPSPKMLKKALRRVQRMLRQLEGKD